MRLLAIIFLCLLPSVAAAKPSRYPPVTPFDGDKYASHAQLSRDVTRAIRCPPPACQRGRASKAKHLYRTKPRQKGAPVPRPRPGTVAPLTMAEGVTREVGRAFIRGRLICAANVGQELARRGIKGTGSRLAKSYLGWGRASPPVPGAVAVFNRGGRGGHVAIVHSVRPDGTVIYLNPSARRQAWVVGPYGRRPIAFRVAS